MKKEAKQNKHVKAKTKQTNKNLGFLGNGITHARTSLHAQARLCVHKSLPRKTKNIENKAQTRKKKKKKPNSNNLACSETKQNYILT